MTKSSVSDNFSNRMSFRNLAIIAKGRGAEDVARAILTNEYADPIGEIKKHNWNSFEYSISLELSRKHKIEGKESENIPTGGHNFTATFGFVHFLAITDKFKVLSEMKLSDDEQSALKHYNMLLFEVLTNNISGVQLESIILVANNMVLTRTTAYASKTRAHMLVPRSAYSYSWCNSSIGLTMGALIHDRALQKWRGSKVG